MSETLYNGISLPDEWPPRDQSPATSQPMRVPYLERPPGVIPIDGGRQLLVDDFLIEESMMPRAFHRPVKHTGNPVLYPETPDERNEALPPTAIPKCGGVWYDERDRLFKMWYMASYLGAMAYAVSSDGIHWERPSLDVVPGTNLILPRDVHPDSGTAWLDHETADPAERFKMQIREPNIPEKGGTFGALMLTSPDGIHWTHRATTGPMGDRSTIFYNPFREVWVQSIRSGAPGRGRCRCYFEHPEFLASGNWQEGEPVFWTAADCMDLGRDARAELYNLDAVAYESLMVGFYQILKGPPNHIGQRTGEPKLTELVLATSRDGFHWHRPNRRAFIAARREPGSWEYGYVESTGGVMLVVGDELWFYYSASGGDPDRITDDWRTNGMYGNGAVGLAKLRRDGFASLQGRFPGASMTTRPVQFSGDHLFVNAGTVGSRLRVECLDEERQVIPGFTLDDCEGFIGNSTRAEIRWKNGAGIGQLAGRPVRLRFQMDRGDLYSFWVSRRRDGRSGGYVAGGGPAFTDGKDA
ncbi:MAG: glycosyl hydrolase family 32 [Candidatus Brocadiia bacterium]